jgi:hypothetical protein
MRAEAEMDSKNGSEPDEPVLHDKKTPPVRRFVCGGPLELFGAAVSDRRSAASQVDFVGQRPAFQDG